jgi:hypothetical protein
MPLHLHKDPYIQMLPHIVFYISECFFMFIFGQFPQGAAGNIDFCEKIKVSIRTRCRSDVRVFRNKIALVTSRSSVMLRSFPCVLYSEKRMTMNVAITTRCKKTKDNNNSPPLDIELKLSGKHFFDFRQIIKQDEFVTIICFVLALVDSFKVNIKNAPSSNSAKPVHSQNFLLYHNR